MKYSSNWEVKTDLMYVSDVKAAIEAGLKAKGAKVAEVKETYHAEPIRP